ncbi:MAG: DMT family transporter [Betaproteobacteria bacterium]|nr:DMT family transporter [Betaproteobacteria bacterium]
MPTASGLMLALIGAIAFSGKAIIVKLAYRHGVDAVTLIMYRMVMAFPFFVLLAWWASRQDHARANPLTRRDVGSIFALGFIGYYFSSYLDFLGLQYISASLERLILYLNPTMVLLMGWVFYRRRITRWRALAMAVSYSGVVLVFGHELTLGGQDAVWGSSLVLASALSYAIYLVMSGQMVQRIGAMRLVGLASGVASVCCWVQFLWLRPLSAMRVPTEVLWLSLVNATLCTVVPLVLVMMAIERIGAALTSQAGMIGPMATIALGVWLLDEPFNAWTGMGTLLVLGGIYMVSKLGDR